VLSIIVNLLVSQNLITAELIGKMRTWKHSGFHVYAEPTITHKEDAVRVGSTLSVLLPLHPGFT